MSNGKRGAGPVRSTTELAARLGVSRWTVSRALNGHPVEGGTRERILAEARRSGFLPHAGARAMRSGKARLVGAVVRDLENFNLTGKLGELQRALGELGYHLVMEVAADGTEAEGMARAHLLSMQPAAILRFAATGAVEGHPGRPEVVVDPLYRATTNAVRVDRATGARLGFEYLVRAGCRKVVALGIDPGSFYGGVRTAALRRAAGRHGFGAGQFEQRWDSKREGMDEGYGAALVEGLRPAPRATTGILALNDRVALGARAALRAKGPATAASFRFVGYDNDSWSAYTEPPLTTIDPQGDRLIAAAIEMLRRLLAGENDLPERVIRPRLIERGT